MSRVSYLAFLFLTAFMLISAAVWCESTGLAQGKDKFIAPKVVTTDGVRLNVLFYPSPKKNSPVVIMLHPVGVGESINQPGWKALAEKLQENNYSVAMFDFRGHGDSKTLDDAPEFWKQKANFAFVKPVPVPKMLPEEIDVKDYIKSGKFYLPVLVNDIAAVKAMLDKKNDAGECNSASTIVLGAESGGTLGAIWINSQWNCYKYTVPPMVGFMKPLPVVEKRAEGNDIVAAVFLNAQPSLGGRTVSLTGTLKVACFDHAMPALFLYGQQDAKAKDLAKAICDKLKPKGSKKHESILPYEILNTKLAGVGLLQKGLKTSGDIVDYLDSLSDKRNEWEMRDFNNSAFGWRSPQTKQFSPGKRKDQKILQFDTYEKFIPQ